MSFYFWLLFSNVSLNSVRAHPVNVLFTVSFALFRKLWKSISKSETVQIVCLNDAGKFSGQTGIVNHRS
jgi:hypothetical protein